MTLFTGRWRVSRGLASLLAVVFVASFALYGTVEAATLVKVNEYDSSWSTADTRPGGSVSWTDEFGAPDGLGDDSLKLVTGATTTAKAQLLTDAVGGTPVTAVSQLSYWTYKQSASFAGGRLRFSW